MPRNPLLMFQSQLFPPGRTTLTKPMVNLLKNGCRYTQGKKGSPPTPTTATGAISTIIFCRTLVLKDVSFTAKQGEVTALVGPSGGGKTTVSRLAARFWDVSRGKITVGGMDISKIDPEALLSLFSIVFQDVTLFDNTILENIRIGNKDATDEQVLAAAKLANVDEFAEKLPEGWHTNIGENGCELSGGERQRISIARAFLKNAPIILLDEATASLDVENETLIQTALSRLIADKTVLVIAHRMRTVAGADKIVVLSEGTVAEEGAPKTLLEQNGLYARMVKLQTESQSWKLA